MNAIDPITKPRLLERFCEFSDAVLRKVQHTYLSTGKQMTEVTLSAMDKEAPDGWSNVVVRIRGVEELVFKEGRTTCQVLSNGLQIEWHEDIVYVDFSPYSTVAAGVEEIRKSDFYIGGETAEWWTTPYEE
jgi:hypothetical protein